MYTRFTTLTNELKFLGRIIPEEDRVEKILTRVLPITWESKITDIQESKNIATLPLDELIGNLIAYELRRQTMKMDVPKKEMSLALIITEGSDLEDDEMAMITKDFKKYLRRVKGSSRSRSYSKSKAPKKQINDGCYKYGKTDHHIKNCPLWEIEWKKERVERRNRKKEQVQPKKSNNKGSTKAMVTVWGEKSYESSDDDDEDEQSLMAIGESDEETEGKRMKNIYVVDLSTLSDNELTCLSALDNDPLIWHKILGHASISQLNKLVSKDLVIALPNIKFKEDKICEACAKGKQVYLDTILTSKGEAFDMFTSFEHDDEAIGLVRNTNETTSQTEVAPEEGIGDGTGPSSQGNLTWGTEQRGTDPQTSREPVHELVPQSSLKNLCAFDAFLTLMEPKSVVEALQDADWVNAMQDELNQFKRSQVWHLVPRPKDISVIGTKWGFRNKLDEDGTVTRNKAPRAWYERLSNFLLEQSYKRGKIDNTLFLKEKDEPGSSIDQKLYRGMIGSLLYLTASRPDIVFSVGLYASFQANLKESHLTVVKRILSYLKGTTDLCLWYPKGSNFNLVGYVDADYAGFLMDRKSTSGCIPIFCDNTSAISMTRKPLS
ncbi:uncharacterized protein [Nicotiana tomentosiformis]|uniref:uncharacterized protein n=1 Tax=Nicotiana tomentosiformis TaxID=4098 RepID=UPI00388C4FBC